MSRVSIIKVTKAGTSTARFWFNSAVVWPPSDVSGLLVNGSNLSGLGAVAIDYFDVVYFSAIHVGDTWQSLGYSCDVQFQPGAALTSQRGLVRLV